MNPNGHLKFNDLFLAAAAQVSHFPWIAIQPDPSNGKLAVYFEDTPALRAFVTEYTADRVQVPARSFMRIYNSLMTQVRQRRDQSARSVPEHAKEPQPNVQTPQSR